MISHAEANAARPSLRSRMPQTAKCLHCSPVRLDHADQTDLRMTERNHPSIRRNAIGDDANSAVPFAPEKGLPLGISSKEGAAVSNRAWADSLANEIHRRGLGGSKPKNRGAECERS